MHDRESELLRIQLLGTCVIVGAELLGTAVVAPGIQFGAAPPHTIVGLTPVGAMED
jgi:hypothetical protein